MKRFIYSIVPFMLTLVLLQGCKKVTTEGFTTVTSYPVITVSGDASIFIKAGEAYVEPGVAATLNGEDVTEDLDIKSTVNTQKPGKYSVTYAMTNADGFKAEQSRTVYVYDATPSAIASKFYTVAAGSNRNGSTAYSGYPVAVYQVAPGVFNISDFLGGYYEYRAGYGSAYAAEGSFKLNADNTLSLVSSSVAGWGDELDELKDGAVSADGTITFTAAYAGAYDFNVILK